ncbi:MAG: hypothetical protein AAFO81_03470 [Pseudomonadota bacterium]
MPRRSLRRFSVTQRRRSPSVIFGGLSSAMPFCAARCSLVDGGDLYDAFASSEVIESFGKVSQVMLDHYRTVSVVSVPPRGRQIPVVQ